MSYELVTYVSTVHVSVCLCIVHVTLLLLVHNEQYLLHLQTSSSSDVGGKDSSVSLRAHMSNPPPLF